jgi:3-phenylpropionate/trans-cinnamate dioxygenase ferredoxin reductase subunit
MQAGVGCALPGQIIIVRSFGQINGYLMNTDHIAIVGGGQAAASLAARLRSQGFDDRITIFGDEPHLPYQRPPLSKKYLGGEWTLERLYLRPAAYWKDLAVELAIGMPVTRIDPAARTLTRGDEVVAWSKLALVTGASPRAPQQELAARAGVHVLRQIADVDRLRPAFTAGRSLLVVGGGYIGLETAAVAAQAGLTVTVVEREQRILARVACAATAAHIRALHQQHGVTILEGRTIAEVVGAPALRGVRLDDGTHLQADLAVVGIGAIPNSRLATEAGLACRDGILVDAFGRTSHPGIWAAGDCARFPFDGEPTRLESVQNAIDQAACVADDMLGRATPYRPVPWFWSDQYDMKLQIVGLNRGHDALVTRRSDRGESIWYFRAGQLLAVDALNDPRAYMTARKLLEAGRAVTPADIADPHADPIRLLKG